MQQQENPQNKANQDGDDQQLGNSIPPITGTAIAFWIFIIVGVALWILIHDHIPDPAKSFEVFVASIFSLAVVIVVVIQAGIYYRQAKALDAQLEESRKLVAQNERAVKASEANVETVEKTAIYANRAYVVAKMEDTGPYDDLLMFRLRIENTGNTPANHVMAAYSYGLREEPPHKETPEGLIVYDIGFTKTESLGLLAPNGSYHVISTPTVPLAYPVATPEYERWEAGDLKFYCWGRIIYEDIFDEKRFTEFCFVQSQGKVHGYPCKHGNQAI